MTTHSKIDEVVGIIRERITLGEYVAGQRLPSERELQEELGVSRSTIRSAFLRLQSDNLIDIVPRGGNFVRSHNSKVILGGSNSYPPINAGPELMNAGSFIHAMREQGKQILIRYLEPSSIISCGSNIGQKLNIDQDTRVLRRYRVQLVDRVPYRILDGYYLASLFGELVGQEDHNYPLFKWLRENKGLKTSRAHEQLMCRMPSAEEASKLNIARSQPVVEMERWVWAQDINNKNVEILFEYSRIIANASLHGFAYTYEIGDEASQ